MNQATGHLTNWNPVGNSVQGAFAIRSTKSQVMAGGSFTPSTAQAQQGFVRCTPKRAPEARRRGGGPAPAAAR